MTELTESRVREIIREELERGARDRDAALQALRDFQSIKPVKSVPVITTATELATIKQLLSVLIRMTFALSQKPSDEHAREIDRDVAAVFDGKLDELGQDT